MVPHRCRKHKKNNSQSHFTVLCSPQLEVNQETEAEQLLRSVRRAWITVDSEVRHVYAWPPDSRLLRRLVSSCKLQQSGFITTEHLRQVVQELNLPFVDNIQVMGQLRDKIQVRACCVVVCFL